VLAACLSVAACTSSGNSNNNGATSKANAAETANAGAGLDLIFTNQPAPIFATSAYRQQLIEVEAVEALGTPTTEFFFPPGWNGSNSHPFKVCPAQGLPLPNSTSLTNPEEIVRDPYGGGYQLNNGGIDKPQADPVGVYAPTTGLGTYVTCIGKGGTLDVAEWEGDVYSESAPAIWDNSAQMVRDIGPGTLPICTLERAQAGNALHIPRGTLYEHCLPKPHTTAYPMEPVRTHSGITLVAYHAHGPLVMHCSYKQGTYVDTKSVKHSNGVVSTCAYPDGTNLTFAPWGIVK
jgi:hypothetical protein